MKKNPLMLLIAISLILLFVSKFAFAQMTAAQSMGGGASGVQTILDTVLGLLTGPITFTLGVIAIIGFGFAALKGYIEWSQFLYIFFGICIVFGAAWLVDFIIGAVGR